jgi:hypothetical protein
MVEFVFTITQGRSGTHSLFELFKRHDPQTFAVHEHMDVSAHGVLTPDVGQLRRFNTSGLTPEITEFWKKKLAITRQATTKRGCRRYVETAHMNAKCGLIEYVVAAEPENSDDRFRFIILDRTPEKIARSLYEHNDMRHVESIWLWFLHPKYPRNLVDPTPYLEHAYLGQLAWYVREIEARKSAYRSMLLDKGIDVLRINIDQPDWAGTVAESYGFIVSDGDEIHSYQGKSSSKRSEVEQQLREIFDSIPA